MHEKQFPATTRVLIIQSALIWSCVPALYSFLPVYLSNIGFHESQIGILLALGPLMSALMQPFIGMAADRSNYKNTILVLLMGGAVGSILLFPLYRTYLYVFLILLVLACFQSALVPISETITLESLDVMKKSYGPVRAFGTIGYSITAILLGLLINRDMKNIFYVTASIGFLAIISALFLPKIRGHQSEGHRVAIRELFKDRLLMVFMLFAMVAQLVLSFYQAFFPLFYKTIGGNESQLGVIYFISAMSELPFLFYAEKIIRKLGIQLTLALSMGVIALRFLLFYIIKSPLWIYPISALHGLTFIVFAFSLAVYINKTVKKELRATGQTINGFISTGIGRIIGLVVGSYLVEGFGLFNVMLYAFVTSVVSIALFILFCTVIRKKHGISLTSA